MAKCDRKQGIIITHCYRQVKRMYAIGEGKKKKEKEWEEGEKGEEEEEA